MSDKIEVNRRRVLGGLVTIGAAGAAVGAGTFAAFSDEETSDGNTITAGTIDLNSTSTGVFSFSGAAPGDNLGATHSIQSTYVGTISSVNVDISGSLNDLASGNEPTEPSGNTSDLSGSEFAKAISVQLAELVVEDSNGNVTNVEIIVDQNNGTDQTTNAGSDPGTENTDLAEVVTYLNNGANEFTNVQTDDIVRLNLDVSFDSEAGNDYQADGVELAVTFTASNN